MPSVHQYTLAFGGDAFQVFHAFKDQPQAFFLDSSLHNSRSRFSYLGFAPFATVRNGGLSGFKKTFDKYRLRPQSLTFPAGAVGYLGYDGSIYFGLYDTILAIDHQKNKLIVSSFSKGRIKDISKKLSVLSGGRGRENEGSLIFCPSARRLICPGSSYRTVAAAKQSNRDIWSGPDNPAIIDHLKFKSNFTKAGYMQAVRQALGHIRRGDIYQINLSHQIKLQLANWRKYAEPSDIYRNLRQAFPSEFGAYLDDGKQVILSASPERFLKLHKGIAQVKPMKGTRPRGKNKAQDMKFKEQLEKSPKEIAELLMVTDLERNDLGRVCDYSSVKVQQMRAIEAYLTVFQATSTIEGRLRRGCDQFDLLQAAFPSGSVTGCPKIEAMKIIKKLERVSRGLYTGAMGYMSFSGDMDLNVMIRTMFLKKNGITFHVGGGIVADSRPQDEWQETLLKARPLIYTLNKTFL